jgi:hypothetical protein
MPRNEIITSKKNKQYIYIYDNSVGIRAGKGIDGRSWIYDSGKIFSLLHSIQSGSGAHPVSYPMVTGGYFPRG